MDQVEMFISCEKVQKFAVTKYQVYLQLHISASINGKHKIQLKEIHVFQLIYQSGISAIATSSPYFGRNHGTDESTIDEAFHPEDVPLIEPREFLVIAWSAIETLRIEKTFSIKC
ncbi:MAG: hypothetical protein EZS28_001210 [Streblomastix strix]|uniref:Uncharacterized protein n=1 Tax=Streblomastix strix TaxID=222440 RepID=A0A5J4X7T4_9EUKA|nr:MAG: hypothetical protein EZS28_001210 [Streblomastix strix]